MSLITDLPFGLFSEPGLQSWCILACYRGSIAHGMWTPPSDPLSVDDKDVMAFCVPTLDYYYGLKQYGSGGTKEVKKDEWDIVIYEARKAISLLGQGNPNILSALWVDPDYYLRVTEAGALLIDNRQLFVGKHVYNSFIGYAYSQLERMEKYSKNGYMGEKRKGLVDRFGFDPKNAAHLIRLLRMGIEFLQTGVLEVERHDAKELLEIKRGEWPLEKVKEEAAKLFAGAKAALEKSTLPERPNMDLVNRLCTDVVESAFREREMLSYYYYEE